MHNPPPCIVSLNPASLPNETPRLFNRANLGVFFQRRLRFTTIYRISSPMVALTIRMIDAAPQNPMNQIVAYNGSGLESWWERLGRVIGYTRAV